MEIIIHRINSLKELIKLPTDYGTEIDIRSQGSRLILNHEPFKDGSLILKSFLNPLLINNFLDSS